jgi:hypothetical protein
MIMVIPNGRAQPDDRLGPGDESKNRAIENQTGGLPRHLDTPTACGGSGERCAKVLGDAGWVRFLSFHPRDFLGLVSNHIFLNSISGGN